MSFSELSMQVHSNSRQTCELLSINSLSVNPFLPCSYACFTPVETRGLASNFFPSSWIECTRTPFWLIAASVTWSFVLMLFPSVVTRWTALDSNLITLTWLWWDFKFEDSFTKFDWKVSTYRNEIDDVRKFSHIENLYLLFRCSTK